MKILLPALLVALLAGSAFCKAPNIVFLFSDDHACHAISAYGSRINKTPNIDRIANDGAIFLNSFCVNSICGPSRATVMTGKHSHKNGFLTNSGGTKFNGGQFTFPKELQKAGYTTAMIGKWHLGSTPTGFNYWDILPGQGAYYNPDFIGQNGNRRIEGYCTTITTDLALDWLEKNKEDDKPFLLMCQYKAPHRTWAPDLKHLNNYADADIPEPATLFDTWENRSPMLAKNAMSIDKHFYYAYDLKVHQPVPFASKRETHLKDFEYRRMTPTQKETWDAAFKPRNDAFLKAAPTGKDLVRWKYQRYVKNYLRTIDSVDENIGRVLDYLDEQGLSENTIVIYSSDQGFYLGDHGWYDKRWMFEESLKMPFVIRWPGKIKPGSRMQHLIQNIDYAPTFLDAAGVAIPDDVQGKSLLPLFADAKNADWRTSVYYHYYEHGGEHQVPRHEGVRNHRYKLINFYSNDGLNLFDLERDPNEMVNLADNPEHKAVLATMTAELERLRTVYDLPERKK